MLARDAPADHFQPDPRAFRLAGGKQRFQHLALTPPDGRGWLARFLATFLAGVMFGLLNWWFKRLSPLIIGHWVLDVLGLGLPVFLLSLAS